MPRRKHVAVPLLLLILALSGAGTAPAAILQKGSQILNLVAPANNNGNVAFSELSIRNSDGSVTPFVLPANTVLIINKIAWNFIASQLSSGSVQFNLGEYYRMGATITNSRCSGIDSILPGVAATNMNAKIFLEQIGDPARTPISGLLSMRIVGYTAPDN
jgi:hypothetical protein